MKQCYDCNHVEEDDGEYQLELCKVCRQSVCQGCMADHALQECGWEKFSDD